MAPLVEPLDRRLLLAVAPHGGAGPASALDLGTISGIKTTADYLPTDQNSAFYKLTLKSRGNLTTSIFGLSADANLEILNSKGSLIASSVNTGLANDIITQELPAGIYYARVFAAKPGATISFTLRTQADLNWTSLVHEGKRKSIGLVFADDEPQPIRNKTQTWIICHGWTSSPDSLADISAAVHAAEPASQILALDWSSVAGGGLMSALSGVKPVAAAAVAILKRWGIPGSRINLIGHSFGGFMVDRIAAGFAGGVNRIVAIDPADDLITSVDYAARSRYSLAFIASTLSTPAHALTADATFKVDLGTLADLLAHTAVPSLYATMVRDSAGASPNAISRLFALNRLAPAVAQPWKSGSGYEGTLKASGEFLGGWTPTSLTYKAASSGKTVTIKA